MKGFDFIPMIGFLVILLMISGRTIQLRKTGIQPGSTSKPSHGIKWILYPLFTLIIMLWLYEMNRAAFHFSYSLLPAQLTTFLVRSFFLQLAGVLLILGSLVLLKITLTHFGNSLRFGFDKKNRGALVTKGIFSLSRNPFFLSLNIYFTGVAIIFPNLFFIGFAVLSILGTHFFILKEEKMMSQMYGKEYEQYTQKVRRYF